MDDEVGNLLALVDDPLVRHAGSEVDDVACRDVDACAVADAWAADLIGRGLFGVDDFAAIDQRGFTGLDDHHVGGGLVDFGDTALVVNSDGEAVVAEVVLVRYAERRDAMRPDGDRWRCSLRVQRSEEKQRDEHGVTLRP